MALPPEEIVVGACYKTADDEQRLVWALRDDRVFYFFRRGLTPPWLCPPADAAPTLDEFAGAVTPCENLPEIAQIREEWAGNGDW